MNEEAILFYAENPVEFVEDIIQAKPDDCQADILRSVAKNKMTSVRSGHGVGKSTVEAWAIIWFLATRPYPKIPCTAPTQHQLFDILWAEVSKWLRNNPLLVNEIIWTKEKLYLKGHPEEWFAVARTATKPDALQGFHADNVLYIIDEASGVDDKIFEPVLGSLSTEGARLLMCGNPTQLTGFFYDSHHKNRGAYSTFHIDGRDSERVSDEFIRTIVNMYGQDSDVFRVRVEGNFPLAENDVFIPLTVVEKSIATDYSPRKVPQKIHIGCDVARFGKDKTVIGYRVDEKFDFYKKINGQDTMLTADSVVSCGEKLLERYPEYKDHIAVKIDDGGVGGGVTDRLRQIKRQNPVKFEWLDVYPVKFGEPIKHKYYADSTTYMMAVVKSLLSPYDLESPERVPPQKPIELILPDDTDLTAQLSCRKYVVTDNEKIKAESKREMKKRGLPSPDEADCLLLTCCPIKQRKRGKQDVGK